MDTSPHSAVLNELRSKLRKMQRGTEPVSTGQRLASTGIPALDGLLTPGWLRPGMIVEWVTAGAGSGAARLACPMVTQALHRGGALVVVDAQREFYPPAAVQLGLDLTRTIVIRPHSQQETIWTLEQSLRCSGVAATWAWLGKLPDRAFRRLQLAAEHGAGLGVFLRTPEALAAPSWADLRWLVEPASSAAEPPLGGRHAEQEPETIGGRRYSSGRRVRVELLHCREGIPGGTVYLEIDDETGAVRVVSPLVAAAGVPHAARA
ncbi:MAG: hypothetical protein JSS02_25615 [Planctomycetes bacterium]|nr:hypothetical protein [Planctomycetota bacterium]